MDTLSTDTITDKLEQTKSSLSDFLDPKKPLYMQAGPAAFHLIDAFIEDHDISHLEQSLAIALLDYQSSWVEPGIAIHDFETECSDRHYAFIHKNNTNNSVSLSPFNARYENFLGKKFEYKFRDYDRNMFFYGHQPNIHFSADSFCTSHKPDECEGEEMDKENTKQALLFNSSSFQEFLQYNFTLTSYDINENQVTNFVNWVIDTDEGALSRVENIMKIIGIRNRADFFNAFLATEFGDDFGNRILTIIEHTTPQQSKKVFETIATYREQSKQFASWYEAHDPELTKATEKAMNERLTDVITVVAKVAKDGPMTVDTAPHRDSENYRHDGRFDVTIKSVDEALEMMQLFETSMRQLIEIVPDKDSVVSRAVQHPDEAGFQIYRFSHPERGDALLHVREHGAGVYDRALEYGNYDGVEATISWVTNPVAQHMLALDKDPHGVSIRFDREGRRINEAPDSDERTPVRDEGVISLDVSSVMGGKQTPGVRIGRMIAAGNILRASYRGEKSSLHHNTNYFNQEKYGNSKGFAELARYISTMAEARIADQQHSKVGKIATKRVA
jgi:hypothetical protein